jgi:hypothetical protein
MAVENTAQVMLNVLKHQENTAHKHSTKATSLPSASEVDSDCEHKAGCRSYELCGTAQMVACQK